MNKRLEQMMWKAAEDMPQCYYVPPQFWEKFAELIVKECAEFANEHNEEIEGVTLGVGQALKKHFGVEE